LGAHGYAPDELPVWFSVLLMALGVLFMSLAVGRGLEVLGAFDRHGPGRPATWLDRVVAALVGLTVFVSGARGVLQQLSSWLR
jgi:hypothetical protein